MYIQSWDHCKIGDRIIEDTFLEVYDIVDKVDGIFIAEVVGYQIIPRHPENHSPIGCRRPLDFEPNCSYDQPWILVTRN